MLLLRNFDRGVDGRSSRLWPRRQRWFRLGLKKRMIQYYEKGARDGRPVEIPLAVRLACYAISAGITDFDGRATSRTPLGVTSPATVAEPADDDMPDAPPAART